MSRGNIYFLGENPDFRVLTDQIFARNDVTGGTIIVPFRIEFSSFMKNGSNRLSKAEVLWLKGELRTEEGIRISEGTILDNHMISNSKLSFQSQFQFSFAHEVINQIESKRKDDLLLTISVAGQAALYEEISFSNGQNHSFVSGFDKGRGHINFQIPQSYWINKVLPQIGYNSFRLIEVPLMSQIIPQEYSKSLKELDEAKRYYLQGDYDKVVGHCRSALDPFKSKRDEVRTFIKSKSESAWINDVLNATDEWLNKLVKSTSHFTSKTHHAPSVGHFDRSESEIIMMVTTAVIAYIGKLENT